MKSTIEEFFPLYRNVWKYLLQNMSGLDDEDKKEKFVKSFLLQMLILWFIQRKNFFNEDSKYLITRFKEITTRCSPFRSYFEFIIFFLKKIDLHTKDRGFHDKFAGKIVIPGPVIILSLRNNFRGISIPNKCFYIEEFSDHSTSKKNGDLPILSFFDNHVVNFDGFIFSEIYEKFITRIDKKTLGTYYTPEAITSYITKTTIESYLFDTVNTKFDSNFKTISSIINSREARIIKYLIFQLQNLKILDPAVGTGHLLESTIKCILEIYEEIWRDPEKFFLLERVGEKKNRKIPAFLEITNENDFRFSVVHDILSNNIYGVDTNLEVLKIAKARLVLLLSEFFNEFNNHPQNFPIINLNLKEGNTLLGYITAKREKLTKQLKLNSFLSKYKSSTNLESFGNEIEELKINDQVKAVLDQRFSQEFSIDLDVLKKVKTFHWISEFPDIFLKGGGFNLILANPPYLGESGSKELFRIYAKALPDYYEGKMDLWYLFLQRSLDLMALNAFSSFITSNYWVTATGAAKLRSRLMLETFIVQYINFGENKVFDKAQGVHINLITFKKARKTNINIRCVLFDNTYPLEIDLIQKLTEQRNFIVNQEKLLFDWDNYVHFLSKNIRVIIEQIIENSALLKNSGFYVKEGIVTGLNNITRRQIKKYELPEEWAGLGVFILNKNNPQDVFVIKTFSQEEKIHLKKFYKNSDISRYYTSIQTDKSILYLNRNTVNLETLPKIKTHLHKYQEMLQDSLDNPPYINRPRHQDIFTSPKIITPQRRLRNTFAYNSFDWYAAQDVYFILSNENNKEQLKSLLLILNSKLAYFWFFWMGKKKGNQLELFGEPLSFFPISIHLKIFPLFVKLCEYLIFLHSSSSKEEKRFQKIITYLETQIVDSLIYELYLRGNSQETAFNHPTFPLFENLSRKIKRIEFDKWELLHYKEKSGEEMSQDENFQIEILKKHNKEIIEESYSSLHINKHIGDLISQIKTSDSVNTIEKGY